MEENIFIDSLPDPNKTPVGLTIVNSGAAENEVYKNTYTNLYAGQNFLSVNATFVSHSTFPGLQTLCNTFNNSRHRDIHVGALGKLPFYSNNSIRSTQGSMYESAGNQFNGSPVLNIDNTKSQISMNYYYGNANNEYPNNVASVTRTSTTSVNSCPSKIGTIIINGKSKAGGEVDMENALAQYDEWNATYKYWLAKAIEVCGVEAESRKQKAESRKRDAVCGEEAESGMQKAESGDEGDECAVIWGMVSHYSALKDNYFNSIVVATMNEEAEGRKQKAESDEEEELETRNPKLETLRFLFNYRGQYGDNLSIAETYLAENNYNQALATLAQMYELFKVNEEQTSELNGLEIYIQWRQQLYETGKNIYELTAGEVEYLVNYVETNSGRGTVFANNILCELYGICIEEAEGRKQKAESGEEAEGKMQKAESGGEKNSYGLTVLRSCGLEIYPNPGKDYITVVSEVENCHFELIDAKGTVVKSVKLQQGSNTINTSSLKQGIYIYRAVSGDKVVSGKWVKT
jgi:hypothetical protein